MGNKCFNYTVPQPRSQPFRNIRLKGWRPDLLKAIFIREYLDTINQEQMSFGVNLASLSYYLHPPASHKQSRMENRRKFKWSALGYLFKWFPTAEENMTRINTFKCITGQCEDYTIVIKRKSNKLINEKFTSKRRVLAPA